MTAKNVIELALIFTGNDDILSTATFKSGGSAISAAQQKEVDLMVRCLNLIIEEIAMEYIPIINEKDITFSDKKILLSSIDANYHETISVVKSNKKLKYREIGGYLYCNADSAKIKYSTYPTAVTLTTSSCEDFNKKISAKILAYGVAMEYNHISTLSDEATIWENKFKNSLLNLVRKKSEIIMPKRGWF